jgi:hypothetical protein
MMKKALSLVTLLAAAVLMLSQSSPSRADYFYSTALTSVNGNFSLYVVGSASGNAAGADGWIYLGTADGNWVDGQVTQLDVETSTEGVTTSTMTIFGWFDDWSPGWYTLTTTEAPGATMVSVSSGDYNVASVQDSMMTWGWMGASK